MKHLFCIFNANDPTPTAYAIRSAPYENVTVFVLGRERFSNRQERSLYRLKKWLSGSAKGSENWPTGLWNESWNWSKPKANVDFVEIGCLSESVFEVSPDSTVIVDLKSGTKRMSIEMMEYATRRFDEPQFIMSNNGSCIALSHGLVVPTPRLSLNEMVWLSSGFVIDVDYSPDFESSVDAIQELSFVRSGSNRFSFKQSYLERMGKSFSGDYETDRYIFHDYLEEFTAFALKHKKEIAEVYGGVRFIYPRKLKNCLGRAQWAILKSRNPDRYTVEHRTELEEFFETHSTKNTELIEFVRKKIHTMEIDSLAMTTDGWMLGVECKYGRYGGIDVDRLHAICSRLSPRFYPLIVHTNQSKKYEAGVHQIPFPMLLDPFDSILIFPEVTPTNLEIVEAKFEEYADDIQEHELENSMDIIHDLLLIVKENPISWPEFYQLLQSQGIKTSGLLKFIKLHYSEKLGFSLDRPRSQTGVNWINWY